MKRHAEVSQQLTQANQEGIELEIGDPMLVKPQTPSLNQTQQRLNRLLLDRGRVWRQCTPNAPSGGTVVISTVPPTETGQPGDPSTAKENGLKENMILYAFRENEKQIPIAYLGEFRVVNAQPTSATLEPTVPLDGQQTALINDQSARWSLYEMLPLDSHRIFSDEDTVGQPLSDKPQPIFGQMDEQQLRTIFSTVSGVVPEDPFITAMIQPYLHDGSPATDQEINTQPQDIWQKLEFEKEHKERVDSNNPDTGVSGSYFDPEGYAEVSRLRNGQEASFRVNDIGVFPYGYEEDRQLVDQLVSSGVCQKLGPVYVRTLHDYEEAFHSIQDRFVRRNEDIRRAKRDIDNLNNVIRKVQEEIAYRQQERAKLKEDQAGFTQDKDKMDQLVAALESQKSSLRDELMRLYERNVALAEQLALYNAKLTEEINRRAASVAAQTP